MRVGGSELFTCGWDHGIYCNSGHDTLDTRVPTNSAIELGFRRYKLFVMVDKLANPGVRHEVAKLNDIIRDILAHVGSTNYTSTYSWVFAIEGEINESLMLDSCWLEKGLNPLFVNCPV